MPERKKSKSEAGSGSIGGTGPSSKKLVGCANFVRHNPKSDRFPIYDFDHIDIWCADATNVAKRYATGFGMQIVASSTIDHGNFKYQSFVLQSGTIIWNVMAPYWCDAPASKVEFKDPFPWFKKDEAWDFVKKHGTAVRTVGFNVESAKDAYDICLKNGGKGVNKPQTFKDRNGTISYSEVRFYEDVVIRFVEGRKKFKGPFMPGFFTENRPSISYGLYRMDHIVSNVPCLTDVTEFMFKMVGFHEFGEFTAEDVGTVDSGLNSMVMANNFETILMPVNEPTVGTRRKSQIQSFLEHHRGSGIQHIALTTDDIISTIQKMSAQSDLGGVEFMPNPGESYYKDHVPKKMGNMISKKLIDQCQKYSILIDRDEEGGLLQIFTKPLLDRPTLFVEIIQRVGCLKKDGTQKPACGGFGKGNFGALFKSIEDWEKIRDGEMEDPRMPEGC